MKHRGWSESLAAFHPGVERLGRRAAVLGKPGAAGNAGWGAGSRAQDVLDDRGDLDGSVNDAGVGFGEA